MLQEARIFANFKHFCDVEFASGKCPHLAIRDRSNLRGDGGATSLLHSEIFVMHGHRTLRRGCPTCEHLAAHITARYRTMQTLTRQSETGT
jgi:hypothetical protein